MRCAVVVDEGQRGDGAARYPLRDRASRGGVAQAPVAMPGDVVWVGRPFTETISELPSGARTTRRLREAIGVAVGESHG